MDWFFHKKSMKQGTMTNAGNFKSWFRERIQAEGHGIKTRLADQLGVSPSAISKMLNGKQKIDIDTAEQIEKFFAEDYYNPRTSKKEKTYNYLAGVNVESFESILFTISRRLSAETDCKADPDDFARAMVALTAHFLQKEDDSIEASAEIIDFQLASLRRSSR